MLFNIGNFYQKQLSIDASLFVIRYTSVVDWKDYKKTVRCNAEVDQYILKF
jgi:hypothetical protein